MSYADLWPLTGINLYNVRMCDEEKLTHDSREGHDYNWTDEQIVVEDDGTRCWKTPTPGGSIATLMCEMFGGDFGSGEPVRCDRCEAKLEHGQVVARHMGTSELFCAVCTREDHAPRWYACLWLVNRVFGGPEEGGWWFDAGELVDFRCSPSWENADYHRKNFETYAEEENSGRADISSVLSDGVYRVTIQRTRPAQFFPAERPHYE